MVHSVHTRVQGIPIQVAGPYAEGHPLSADEAQALNAYYASRLASLISADAKTLLNGASFADLADDQRPAIQDAAQALVAQAADGFRFDAGRSGRKADPLGSEVLNIARDVVRQSLRSKGVNISSVPSRKVTELARQVLDNKKHREKITERAKRVIAEREEVASMTVDVAL